MVSGMTPESPHRTVMDLFRLDGHSAVVTGAGRGLGRAMALALAEAGASVTMLDIDSATAAEAAAEGEALGYQTLGLAANVEQSVSVEQALNSAIDKFGHVDIWVNNAGVTTNSPFETLPPEDWDRVLAVNLTGIFNCSQIFARQIIKQGSGGSLINIASMSGLIGNRGGNNSHYCATKGGVIALTRSLSVEWAPHRIRVNAIAPGYFVTPMTDRLKQRNPDFYQELIDRVPLGRFGDIRDLAGAVVYLAGDASAYVSGHILVIDGGYTAW